MSRSDRADRGAGSGAGADRLRTHVGFVVCSFGVRPISMASDLVGTPQTGIRVQLCGDAHLASFGGVASPARQLLLDVDGFDEALPRPVGWDVKRLAASVAVAGRENGFRPVGRPRLSVTWSARTGRRSATSAQRRRWWCGTRGRASATSGAVARRRAETRSSGSTRRSRRASVRTARERSRACREGERRGAHSG